MKYARNLVPLLALCLALTACVPKEKTPDASSTPAASSAAPDVSQPEPDVSTPDISTSDASSQKEEPLPPLTEDDKAGAMDAAYDYYMGTVFDAHSLTEIETKEGEITFRVSCSKGGEKVDPDRFISLERKNGTWSVVNEGY